MCGLGFGTWASFIPYVKDKFFLDEAQLGLLLLSMPVGTFLSNPLTVILIRRWGSVRVSLISGLVSSIFFAMAITSPWITITAIGLFLAGGTFGCTNVAMNTCASILEQKANLKIISTCHGMWSIGAMCGALFSGVLLIPLQFYFSAWIAPQLLYPFLVAFVIILITWWIRNDLSQVKQHYDQPELQPKIKWKTFRPGRTLWILIIICLCTYLTEGTMADWSAVYLREITMAPETIAGWGFAVYAFFMATGRFLGDEFIGRYGGMRVLRAGGILVLLGLLIIIFSQNTWVTLPGFMLVGMGISLASPILYSSAAKVEGLAPAVGLATLNTFAMASFLGGPVLIGFIAKIADLRISFMFVAFAATIWILQTTRVIRKV